MPGDIYWVRPVDGDYVEGIASNYAPQGNNSPYAIFTTHGGIGDGTTGTAAHCVYFDGTPSFDPDGNPIVSYQWDFNNDGTVDNTAPNPLYTFATPGTYTAKLTVSDGVLTGEDSVAIQVNDPGTLHVSTLDALGDAGSNWQPGGDRAGCPPSPTASQARRTPMCATCGLPLRRAIPATGACPSSPPRATSAEFRWPR